MSSTLGIDFGSRVCRAARADSDGVESVPNRYMERPLPLAIAAAEGRLSFRSIKQLLGIEAVARVQGRDVSVIASARGIFQQVRDDVSESGGDAMRRVVVTVPGCFSERQRATLRDAMRAEFAAVRLLDEALAAVLGRAKPASSDNILVYALGAGVFTTTVIRMTAPGPAVISSEGDRTIGGNAFDAAIAGRILEQLRRTPGDFADLEAGASRMKAAAEIVKIGLSRRTDETFDVDVREMFEQELADAPTSHALVLARDEFERLIADDVAKTVELSREAVRRAAITPADIQQVLLVGASTNIPLVRQQLERTFPVELVKTGDVDIARGAALYGQRLNDDAWDQRHAEPPPSEPEPRPEERLAPRGGDRSRPEPPAGAGHGTWMRQFLPRFDEAEMRWNRGDHANAIDRFEQLIQEATAFLANLHYHRGEHLYQADDFEGAILHIRRALRVAREDRRTLESYHHGLRYKTEQLMQRRRFNDARLFIREGLAIAPKCPTCRYLAQQIEQEVGRSPHQGLKKRRRR